MKIKIILVVIGVLISAHVNAQSKWGIEIKGGYNAMLDNTHFSSWGSGMTMGTGIIYQLKPGLKIGWDAKYNNYQYVGSDNHPFLVNCRVEGENSYSIDNSILLRLHGNEEQFGLYFHTKIGVSYLYIGEKIMIDETTNEIIGIYENTGINEIKPFGALGLGFNFSVSPRIKLKIESGYSITFDAEQQYFPMNLIVHWKL